MANIKDGPQRIQALSPIECMSLNVESQSSKSNIKKEKQFNKIKREEGIH